ncbi:MFS transporter [Actinokineospora guangxiensis]|uniref:MFS transporter n=1 Tax=Actinokineospora guangxiensis TaxID=1490288 RepID=A0ABW0EKV8_9PSEU
MIRSGSPDQPPRRGKRGRKGWTDAPQPEWRPSEPPPRKRPTKPYGQAEERPDHRHDEPELETFGDRYPHDYPSGPRPRPPWREDERYPRRYADQHEDRRPSRPRESRHWSDGPPARRWDEAGRGERDHGPSHRGPSHREPSHREPSHREPPRRESARYEQPRYDGDHGDHGNYGDYEPRRRPSRYDEDGHDDHLPARPGDRADPSDRPTDEVPGSPRYPKKLTVTRVAALRSKQLTTQAVTAFRKAAGADGAEKSGLTALTYATMFNYASDAAMAVALANTLFFSAASGESKGKVALYLLITVAPFALVAPIIGPALDRIQRGRRLAMCAVSAGQALMCLIMALNFETWLLYPAALGKMVLSKSFTVLKAAVTPRVLPPEITLAKTNARLTVFGLFAGGVFGAVAVGLTNLFGSPGALWFTVVVCLVGAAQALRIPAWVEVTEGEVPASIKAHPGKAHRQPMGRHIVVALWGNGTIRVLTGFLMMFAAFAVRAEYEAEAFQQVLLLGVIAGAAGLGSFVGNAVGARVHVGKPEQVVIGCAIAALTSTVVATFAAGITTAAIVGLVGAIASALAKNSLDAVIQDDLPEASRASAFGRSETVLQLSWVLGGATGVLLPPMWWLGFLVVSLLLGVGIAQTLLSRRGQSLIPGLGGERPIRPDQTGALPVQKPPAGWRAAPLHEGPPPGPADRAP